MTYCLICGPLLVLGITDWMHARGHPASTRACPAAGGHLGGWRQWARSRAIEMELRRANAMWAAPLHLRAPGVYQVL